MPKIIHELHDLQITRIALVRKGFRPVNDGARITIVKAQEDPEVSEPTTTVSAETSVLDRLAAAFVKLTKGEPEPVMPVVETPPTPEPAPTPEPVPAPVVEPVAKADFDALLARVDELHTKLDAQVAKAEPDADAITASVEAHVKTLLEPVTKAIEDLGIERARTPLTPNVTSTIDATRKQSADQAAAVKDMDFGDAVRHLMHS